MHIVLALSFVWAACSEDSFKWDIINCDKAEVTHNDASDRGSEKILLDAANKLSNMTGHCVAIKDRAYGEFSNYEIRVDMLNVASAGGVNFGHIGIIFNFVDESNYDFLYMRY